MSRCGFSDLKVVRLEFAELSKKIEDVINLTVKQKPEEPISYMVSSHASRLVASELSERSWLVTIMPAIHMVVFVK